MHYLDTASDHADRADRSRASSAAAQHRNDAFRHDNRATALSGCTVETWFNATTGFYGCRVLDATGRCVNGGCGWLTEADALATGFILIEETV